MEITLLTCETADLDVHKVTISYNSTYYREIDACLQVNHSLQMKRTCS